MKQLISMILSKDTIEIENYHLESDREFYGTLAMIILALGVLGVAFHVSAQ